ncbi:MAG: hypothetical protein DMF24_07030 [Verrucomicrobia bacterium]|nr:MAG: hypothetical protein DME90_11350 [Verrucomicrobiota bacterium]PYL61503.1 MAG: hypothetical protein DMF24_07030 [Verrucomicrobiota bacterium]
MPTAGELRTQILIVGDLQYLTADQTSRMAAECRELSRMLWD